MARQQSSLMAGRYLFGLVLICGLTTPVMAGNAACDRKAAEIEQQIKHAQEAGNSDRLDGLNKALSAVREHCTDAGLIKDKKQDITEQEEEIAETLEDIAENQAEGKLDKVKKLERELQREREELDVLRQELAEIEGN